VAVTLLVTFTVGLLAAPGAARGDPAGADKDRKVKQLERLFDALEQRDKELPRDTFDPQAVLAKTGSDPEAIFHWVRDQTYLVPYRGVLRGPVGVLMDRLGNSLDRALLLAELLKQAGHEVRLAHGSVGGDRAKALLPKVRPIPREGTAAPPPTREQARIEMERFARRFQLDAARLKGRVDESYDGSEKMAKEARRIAAEQAKIIAAALGPMPAAKAGATGPGWPEALRDHWWVQRSQDSGWIDLDPTLADATPGARLAEAKETLAPDGLPEDLQHQVQIQVVAEQWKDGKLEATPVLTHTLAPWQLIGTPISLTNTPTRWPADLDLMKEKHPTSRLDAALLEQEGWVPLLRVGAESIQGSVIGEGGGGAETAPASAWGGLMGGVSGGDTSAREDRPVFTAEWIDYEIRSPGRPIHRERREVFDLVGPAARVDVAALPPLSKRQRLERAFALVGEASVLVQNCWSSPTFEEHMAAVAILQNRDSMLEYVRTGRMDATKIGAGPRMPGALRALASTRLSWATAGAGVYLDVPNVLSLHVYRGFDPQGASRSRVALDIVSNEVAVRSGPDSRTFATRLEQGALESSAEAVLAGAWNEGTAVAVLASAGGPASLATIRSRQDRGWKGVRVERNVRARIERDLDAGYVVLVPLSPVQVGKGGRPAHAWWRVDPQTGRVLAIGEQGWGQAYTDHEVVHALCTGVGLLFLYICTYDAIEDDKAAECIHACIISWIMSFGSGLMFAAEGMASMVLNEAQMFILEELGQHSCRGGRLHN
jgi:hypothetical protein